ncbi:MAG: twin-arginine translocase subunit TatC [Prevotellaceae bacterium]|nr:twin-arginine translocase subunit TatC [Candidatus Faecinaster equi]
MSQSNDVKMTFWEHVEVFRKGFIKCIIVWVVCSIAAFCFKDLLFSILFAPSQSDFILYRGMCRLAEWIGVSSLCPNDFEVQFINIELASQFMIHLEVALIVGLFIAIPYLITQLFGFVAPALYEHEKKYSFLLVFWGLLLFFLGVALNYFIVFPFAFRFLSTYQVQELVINQIALKSYISTLLVLSLLLGILFEIPIIAYFLGKLGVITAETLKQYRKHAFVVLCILAAIITPTADIFTLLLVTVPLYLLFEVSIKVLKVSLRART